MPTMNKRSKKVWLYKLFRLHATLTAIFLGLYLMVALFDPGFLAYDLRQKYHALADDTIAVTATVLGPPEQPIVTGDAVCDGTTGTLTVVLDWGDDPGTETYDIDRDSLPLVTGLTTSGYEDAVVVVGTTYEYVVTAHGPMDPGIATSLPVQVVTPDECEITLVAPTVAITSFDGRGIGSYGGAPHVSARRPVFTGTTNIPDALVQVAVGAPSLMFAEFTANSNGYWSWKPPTKLSSGTQLFTITVIDPDDDSRQASASLSFKIDTGEKDTATSTQKEASPRESIEKESGTAASSPVTFSLKIDNHDKTVQQGDWLSLSLFIEHVTEQYDNKTLPIHLSIIDSRDNTVTSFTWEELLARGRAIRQHFPIPLYIAAGKYSLQIEIFFDQINVSRTDELTIAEVPLIQLGGGAFITYAEIVHNIGWIALVLSALLFIWIFLFLREYGMSLRALRHITERQLQRAGLFTKRKGVTR